MSDAVEDVEDEMSDDVGDGVSHDVGDRGDGEACEMCVLGMAIVSSTVVDGKVKRAYRNQVCSMWCLEGRTVDKAVAEVEGGLEVYVLVRDALGAVATSGGVTVNVSQVVVEGAELTEYMDDKMALGEASMANGDTDKALLLVDGMSKIMNVAAERRRRRRRRRVLLQEVTEEEGEAEDAEVLAKAQEQRQAMLDILGSAQLALAASDSSLQRMATSASEVVTEPEETGGPQQWSRADGRLTWMGFRVCPQPLALPLDQWTNGAGVASRKGGWNKCRWKVLWAVGISTPSEDDVEDRVSDDMEDGMHDDMEDGVSDDVGDGVSNDVGDG
eukprot:gene17679-21060_t